MTHRERMLGCLEGRPIDRVPDLEFGALDQTYARWAREGMPAAFAAYAGHDEGLMRYFHTDDDEWGPSPWVHVGMFPAFTREVLEDHGERLVIRDDEGTIQEVFRDNTTASMPRFLRHAIETREDWEKLKRERLDPAAPGRVPEGWDAACARSLRADWPVTLWCGSLYGWIRNWMGVERLSLALYEEPEWVEEMMEHLTGLLLVMFARLAGKCRIDLGTWWEDMCYKTGPLLSPAMFARLMVPRYGRVVEFLRRECGCIHHIVDCDGRINELAPLWVEAGIDVLFPLEYPATDVFALRAALDGRATFRGGFDKRALIAGPDAIDREFERLAPLVAAGRLMPHTDHRVPPDVPLAHYRHYRQRKCRILGKPYREG